jgi:hypothetical protein
MKDLLPRRREIHLMVISLSLSLVDTNCLCFFFRSCGSAIIQQKSPKMQTFVLKCNLLIGVGRSTLAKNFIHQVCGTKSAGSF